LQADLGVPGRPLPGASISLLITGDEEGRGLDGTVRVLDWLKARGERLDYCLVGEPTNPRTLGEMVKIGRRGSLNGRLRVFGTQGHVAYPHLADNPLPRLIDMLKAITETALDQGTAHFQPSTLALTSIDVGNPTTNLIPAEGRAAFNVRFNDAHTGRSVERWLRGKFDAVGGDYELEIEISGESFLTPPGILSDALREAIVAETGQQPELSTSGGTSDARFIKDACPVAEFGLVGQTMHKADERVSLADLECLTRIYRRVGERVLGLSC
jgi:succinyl-diaminopimelate desuccinylase